MLVDSHAHLDFYEGADLDRILANASEAGLGGILSIGIGDGPETMHRALDFATTRSTPRLAIYASAGIHPSEAGHADEAALGKLRDLAAQERVIAIGEIGLDYYHVENPEIDVQKAAFRAQMRIAAEARKPILLHCRTSELATPAAKEKYGAADAADDLLTMLETEWAPHGLPGVMHCFSGSVDDAKRALAIGFYLSFAGNLTYPRFTSIRDAAQLAPADRILVETDSPFLAPVPHRGQRNQPAHTAVTAAFLAELRGTTLDAITKQTTENFQRLFPTTRIPSTEN
jgi:TatD DNase family protein